MAITIACIGSGNMGSALMKGAVKIIGGENISFTDPNQEKAQALADEIGARVFPSNYDAVKDAEFVFLAVKPQVLGTVLEEIAPALQMRIEEKKPAILVSMAAGWTIRKIQILLDVGSTAKLMGPDWAEANPALTKPVPVVRIMPNTPALISQGVIAMAASPQVPEETLAELERLLSSTGIVDRIDESYMDAVTGLSGSGPAFVYLFIEALADGGVQAGLPRDKALRYAAQTVLGAAAMVKETGKHPGELKDMVTSPAGTTIAGVAALENGRFRGTVINAVEAAYKRSKQLG
ncbi:pyrroline-5-carboxylate reductase [Treponema primitia ZAS-2]|uniref:Pyrroline-5-carboxylate reductase n=1 Tax=Treponema primitia (strain ATCC BAA-887 / DSM 12427 / ZAS-2) TaxID=545694 RepID=F5YMG7_TREPZ|nr:pyrroline-5-carboxylate reductase [Treponema primitia]AEF83959.1 pyrroline-5-carboxylate reductase [Treponema primitia ZAS-2]